MIRPVASRNGLLTETQRVLLLTIALFAFACGGSTEKQGTPLPGIGSSAKDTTPSGAGKNDSTAGAEKKRPPEPKKLTPRLVIETGLKDSRKVAISPDGKYAAIATYRYQQKNKRQTWDLQEKKKVAEYENDKAPLGFLDGKTLVCCAELRDIFTEDCLTGKTTPAGEAGYHPHISARGDLVFGITESRKYKTDGEISPDIVFLDVKTGKNAREWVYGPERHEEITIGLQSQGEKPIVATGHKDGSVKIWDYVEGKLLKTIASRLPKSDNPINPVHVAVSADGKRVAASRWLEGIVVLDVADGKEVFKTTRAYGGPDLWFLPDGKSLLHVSRADVVIENLETGAQFLLPADVSDSHGHGRALALTADGKTLVTISQNGALKLWDIAAP